MAGLRNLCKQFGGVKIDGMLFVWDYAKKEPVLKSEFSKEDRIKSDQVQWAAFKEQMQKEKPAHDTTAVRVL